MWTEPLVFNEEGTCIEDVYTFARAWKLYTDRIFYMLEIYPLDPIPEAMF